MAKTPPTPPIPPIPTPAFPYIGNQIIIDSGRVTINSKDDMAFILAKKSVGISADSSVNIDTKGTFIVNAQEIRLGIGDDSEHPLVKGDILVQMLSDFAEYLQNFVAKDLENVPDSDGFQMTGVRQAGEGIKGASQLLINRLESLISKKNFTQ
jgi:hypothetical protein